MSLAFSTAQGVGIGLQDLEAAIRASIADGHTYVAGAGAGNSSACLVTPARIPEVITVAATDALTDARWSKSNCGSCVDLYAPGKQVTSASRLSTARPASYSAGHCCSDSGERNRALLRAVTTNAGPSRPRHWRQSP